MTLAKLVEAIEGRIGLEVSMLSLGSTTVYSSLAPPKRQKEWLPMSVHAAVEAATGQPQPPSATLFLQASCYDDDTEEDVEVPTIAYTVGGGTGGGATGATGATGAGGAGGASAKSSARGG